MTSVTQSQFRTALFDPDAAHPEGLCDGQAQRAGKRFDVYRNNIIVSLKDAMANGFPVITKLLGDANFARLSDVYVRAHPPQDPRLVLYGCTFPEFLETFEPLAHLGYLADVARLELALRGSYHAADASVLAPSVFGALAPDALALVTLDLAPSVRVLRSSWPIADIWHFNMSDDAPQPSGAAQDVLVTRPAFDPELHVLPKGSAALITALGAARTLGDALDAAHAEEPDFDFSALLGLLIRQNALSALHVPPA